MNIDQVSTKVFTFDVYNILPGPDGQLDGHFHVATTFVPDHPVLISRFGTYATLNAYGEVQDPVMPITDLIPREQAFILKKVDDVWRGSAWYAHSRPFNYLDGRPHDPLSNRPWHTIFERDFDRMEERQQQMVTQLLAYDKEHPGERPAAAVSHAS